MRDVLRQFEEGADVPFAMRFMQSPESTDLHGDPTITTTYTTECGSSNVLDDGEFNKQDD